MSLFFIFEVLCLKSYVGFCHANIIIKKKVVIKFLKL